MSRLSPHRSFNDPPADSRSPRKSRSQRASDEPVPVDYAPGESSLSGGSRDFVAKFSSKCPCGERIEAGDRVRFVSESVLAHEGCDGEPIAATDLREEVAGLSSAVIQGIRANMCLRCFCEKRRDGICGTCEV